MGLTIRMRIFLGWRKLIWTCAALSSIKTIPPLHVIKFVEHFITQYNSLEISIYLYENSVNCMLPNLSQYIYICMYVCVCVFVCNYAIWISIFKKYQTKKYKKRKCYVSCKIHKRKYNPTNYNNNNIIIIHCQLQW